MCCDMLSCVVCCVLCVVLCCVLCVWLCFLQEPSGPHTSWASENERGCMVYIPTQLMFQRHRWGRVDDPTEDTNIHKEPSSVHHLFLTSPYRAGTQEVFGESCWHSAPEGRPLGGHVGTLATRERHFVK